MEKRVSSDPKLKAYIIGIALGDGNLSNPNGRAVRLRITCDNKYPKLIDPIRDSVQSLLLDNRVSVIKKKTSCTDISCYSNYWEDILGWKSTLGPKHRQKVKIPKWILENKVFIKECLRGLFQTDGSIYQDRKYTMVNFVANNKELAESVIESIKSIGHQPNLQISNDLRTLKYTVRVSKNAEKFIREIELWKN